MQMMSVSASFTGIMFSHIVYQRGISEATSGTGLNFMTAGLFPHNNKDSRKSRPGVGMTFRILLKRTKSRSDSRPVHEHNCEEMRILDSSIA